MTTDNPTAPKPLLLDLFCGEGFAAEGYARAGFHVFGIDIKPQPDYPFAFEIGDALELLADHAAFGVDAVHASPPCQAFTAYRRRGQGVGASAPDLVAATRKALRATGLPYVIENVEGAPLENPITLCGSMFGLGVRRHRLFESNVPMLAPQCRHDLQQGDFPQATNRTNRRKTCEVGVYRIPLADQRKAMGVNRGTLHGLSQGIPPAYTEWIGKQLLAAIKKAA